jgi:hypothetical protein
MHSGKWSPRTTKQIPNAGHWTSAKYLSPTVREVIWSAATLSPLSISSVMKATQFRFREID